MTKIQPIKLEFVRPGPPHNQLLSPLTPYMALCGEGSPVTFNMDFEHYQFLSRLERLRYVTIDGRSGVAIPDRIRETAVAEVGMDVARIFAKVNTVLAEEWRVMDDPGTEAGGHETQLVHLRLVMSGSELSLIPFEIAIAPQAYPGEGLEWALQHHLPIVPTREIRRTRRSPVRWDRELEPKILFISAAPGGLEVPLAPHVHALRTALDPWIPWPKRGTQDAAAVTDQAASEPSRLSYIKKRLRVLPNASIEDIYTFCAKEQFTHVHILAHGAQMEVGGEKRYGLALCNHGDRNRVSVVNGKRLAKALLAEGEGGTLRSQPLMVTLATCDSGNPGSILIPGGGIAYDLHAAGIPWVLASQFPLTKVGSVRMTESFYHRILRGDDPRQVLYEVRRQLYMNAERDHDWASIVAYASLPSDFDSQVAGFFERQMHRAINFAFNHADYATEDVEIEKALKTCIDMLDLWRSRLPEGDGHEDRKRRTKCYGKYGSVWKQIGLIHHEKKPQQSRDDLEKSLEWYQKALKQEAMEERLYHWVGTQTLSLRAVLKKPAAPETYRMAEELAKSDLAKPDASIKAWAHGTLAELAMLAGYHIQDRELGNLKKVVQEHCQSIVKLVGKNSFEVFSTRRQLKRYIDYWSETGLKEIASVAVKALS